MNNPDFFDSQEEQSLIKALIVSRYFRAWAQVMLRHQPNPIAYIDLFSGPGEYLDGNASTPLLLLKEAIKSPQLQRRLKTIFNDRNPMYIERLQQSVQLLPGLDMLHYKPELTAKQVDRSLMETLRKRNQVPTLFFIDPFGYKGMSIDLIGQSIGDWGCDCIFFFNYNRINPGLSNPAVVERMDDLFGIARAARLRSVVPSLSPSQRQNAIVNELTEALREIGGKYVLPFEFQAGFGKRPGHFIVFVSKHFRGYHIMKEVMFKLSSDASEVRKLEYVPMTSPQLRLQLDPGDLYSLTALKKLLTRVCSSRTMTVEQVYEGATVDTPYTLSHVQDALKALEAEGIVSIVPPAAQRPKRNGVPTLAKDKLVTFPA